MSSIQTIAILLTALLVREHPAEGATGRDDSRSERPNFVFFLVDDLGWADLGCNGSTFYETPNIDALAASGMRFTQGYAACPVCSPTRASIMTGRHPVRVDITDWIPGMKVADGANVRFGHVEDRNELALDETTIAEVLGGNGYSTFFAGKWHLGGEGFLPTDQGFDVNYGGHHVGSPPGGYYSPWRNPYLENREDGEYLTERLTEESVRFLRQQSDQKPFLLYLSYYNVHTPIQPYRRVVDHFREKKADLYGDSKTPTRQEHMGESRLRQDNADYASMVRAVDISVGDILRTLEELNLSDNTVVCFFSDNGGLCTTRAMGPTSNLPLRSGKGWLYEGGIREPMIIRAPGVTAPESVCSVPVISTDFFPTILELAGLPLQPELHADGTSLVPLLRGEESVEHPPLFWHYPHYHGSTWTPGAAVRDGDWKLIHFMEFEKFELYNLAEDIGEQTDVSMQHPQKLAELKETLTRWQADMDARMPVPNPDFDEELGSRPIGNRNRNRNRK